GGTARRRARGSRADGARARARAPRRDVERPLRRPGGSRSSFPTTAGSRGGPHARTPSPPRPRPPSPPGPPLGRPRLRAGAIATALVARDVAGGEQAREGDADGVPGDPEERARF